MIMLKPLTITLLTGLLLTSCVNPSPSGSTSPAPTVAKLPETPSEIPSELFQQSWQVYQQRFIQADGRVIDREANDRSTSEGQAYALLRAVWIDDRDTFDRVLQWSETNLQRRDMDGNRSDLLWAWKWGQQPNGNWGTIDRNFASDGDIDAITALIWAAKRWDQPQYLDLARRKLTDLWNLSTLPTDMSPAEKNANIRYLLPGPREAFQPQPTRVLLNPSYFAPYAFRLFAQIDAERNWLSLVEGSYQVLEAMGSLSAQGLPSDWLLLDLTTGKVERATSGDLQSRYGFDAYRVWWRVALDAAWFKEPRAMRYLQQQLQPLQQQWQTRQFIPAQIDWRGRPLVEYESTAQYAMLYAAFRLTNPETATAIYQQKLVPTYRDGFWDNDAAYYVQNLSWFGLFPVDRLPDEWFRT
jgi:endoglucanase